MKLRGVFRGTKLPAGQHTIGTKWVFKIERETDEPIETYKVRFVAKGFKTRNDIDFTETFSPGVKYVTLRVVIVITSTFTGRWNS
uniref:Reverse transcriptase Ty1/copia-type domain-containing protein n=1 Tax=Peronospora matthiolae TaxID=2874970 RepID=A0AAV1V719_9STRA